MRVTHLRQRVTISRIRILLHAFFLVCGDRKGGEDRTRDPRPTSPVLVRFHQPKARSRISPNRQRLPKDSATHNGREEAVGREV